MIPPHGYNSSILQHGGKLLLTFRLHDRQDWRTSLYIAELGSGFKADAVSKITIPEELQQHSHEDARLFSFNGEPWMAWVVSQYPATVFRSIVVVGQLLPDGAGWKVGKHFAPQYGKNDFSALEKSWIPLSHGGKIHLLYMTHEGEQTWLKLDDQGGISDVFNSRALPWKFGPIHGGCIAPYAPGKLVHFFHSRTTPKGWIKHRYHISAAILSAEPPFDMLAISKRPIFYGQEGYCLDDNPRFKPNVVFPAGAIKRGEHWLLAYGENDDKCVVAKIREGDLNL